MATELAKAYVQIIPSAKGIKQQLSEILGKEVGPVGDEAGQTVGNKLVSKIKGIIVAAGIGKALQQSLTQGAALQQSLGGIETLFKDSADKVVANAKNAYKTAGMSANEYMESVTSFSASLLQGLAGDTNKAADVADMALTDMSDNANKMGTSMELIQNAYQGFAKQNYTMLDNLKLGYGGTKTEMERLLKDAQELTGVKYDINNLSDVYNAIHAVQEEMGITGTTAKEAAETYSGSFASMKAAASDFLGNLSLGEDIEPSLNNLLETTKTFVVGNFLPMLGNIVGGIGQVLQQNGPTMINAGAEMLASFAAGIAQKLPDLVPKGFEAVASLADAIIMNIPTILNAGIELLKGLAQGIVNSLPTLIVEGPRLVNDFADAIYSGIWQLLQTGWEIIKSLAQGIWNNKWLIAENAGEILMAFINIFSLSKLVSLGKNLTTSLSKGIESLKPKIATAGKNLLKNLVNGIKSLATHPVTTLKNIGLKAFDAFKNIKWASIGKNIISGIINGIKAAAGQLLTVMKNLAKDALDAVKKKLGIHSPSKVFEMQVGKMVDTGFAAGIKNNANAVTDAMKKLSMETVGTVDADFNLKNTDTRSANFENFRELGDYIVQTVLEQGLQQAQALEKGISKIKMIPNNREVNRYIAEMGYVKG